MPSTICARRARLPAEQADRIHDLARHAVAALSSTAIDEGLLHRVELAVLGKPLDGDNHSPVGSRDSGNARTSGDPVDEHGASTAFSLAATVFGAT